MKLESQYAAPKLCKRLKELGIAQEGQFSWVYSKHKSGHEFSVMKAEALELLAKASSEEKTWKERVEKGIYSAWSVAELGVMLPISLHLNDGHNWAYYHRHCWKGESVGYAAHGSVSIQQDWFKNEAESKANMLILLLDGKLTTPEDCNKRLQEA